MSHKTELGARLGAGKEAEVFAWGDDVLKLYRRPEAKASAFREAAVLALLEPLDLPAPATRGVECIDDRWGVVMTRLEGEPLADRIDRHPETASALLRTMAEVHFRIHQRSIVHLGGLKARLARNIGRAHHLGGVRSSLLSRLADMPDKAQLCHGDIHPLNILGASGEEKVVDWLDACSGDPAADVCRSFVLMKPVAADLASDYVAAYAEIAGIDRKAILRWLPFVAAARLAEGVPDAEDALIEMVISEQ